MISKVEGMLHKRTKITPSILKNNKNNNKTTDIPVHFTREPVTETVITPREGFKLVVRNSKGVGQEEYFVDAVEIIAFGNAIFFRSVEKPKAFLLPVSDYDVIEVRDTRLVLKHTAVEKTIKIGGGKDSSYKKKSATTTAKKKTTTSAAKKKVEKEPKEDKTEDKEDKSAEDTQDLRSDKRRERRRNTRRKRTQDDNVEEKDGNAEGMGRGSSDETIDVPAPAMKSLIPPPKTLIFDRKKGKEASEENKEVILLEPPSAENVEELLPKEETSEKEKKPKKEKKEKKQPKPKKKKEATKKEKTKETPQEPPKPKKALVEKEVFKEKTQSFLSLLDEEFDG